MYIQINLNKQTIEVGVHVKPVHTGDKVKFHTVDFVEKLCHFGHIHTGDKVERTYVVRHSGDRVDQIGDNVNRDKLSSSSCCRFVAKTGDIVDRIGNKVNRMAIVYFAAQQSTLLPVCNCVKWQTLSRYCTNSYLKQIT